MAFTFLPRSRRMALLASTAIGIVLFGAPLAPARANPNGGTVVGGGATIDSAPGSVTVRQTTNRAVIDWQDFSIGNGESTTFEQPGRSSVTLNRVIGDNASTIDGKLTANGNVFLINRNGVLFGAGAQVDVGGLVATTSDIDNDAFMAGGNRFDRPTDNPDARVVNEGRITLADKGIAALVGPSVANNGVIAARLGTVALAGAETFTVDLAGDGLISFDTGQTVDRAGGTPRVANSGTIAAAGGTVILNARQAAGVVDRAIDMTGVIEVGGVAVEGARSSCRAATAPHTSRAPSPPRAPGAARSRSPGAMSRSPAAPASTPRARVAAAPSISAAACAARGRRSGRKPRGSRPARASTPRRRAMAMAAPSSSGRTRRRISPARPGRPVAPGVVTAA